MRRRTASLLTLAALLVFSLSFAAELPDSAGQPGQKTLEERVKDLEGRNGEKAGGCGLAVLFGAFCALWAQNTGRNPWFWFFMGLLFSVITVLALLHQNSKDIQARAPAPTPTSPDPGAR